MRSPQRSSRAWFLHGVNRRDGAYYRHRLSDQRGQPRRWQHSDHHRHGHDAGASWPAVEVSVDGGKTWHPATGSNNWTYTWVVSAPGPITIESRAVDDSGNLEIRSAGITVTAYLQPTSTAGPGRRLWLQRREWHDPDRSFRSRQQRHDHECHLDHRHLRQALSFNGTNSWVTINNSSSLNLSSGMTLEAWVKPTAAVDRLDRRHDQGANGRTWPTACMPPMERRTPRSLHRPEQTLTSTSYARGLSIFL